jgi:hypothetical protein
MVSQSQSRSPPGKQTLAMAWVWADRGGRDGIRLNPSRPCPRVIGVLRALHCPTPPPEPRRTSTERSVAKADTMGWVIGVAETVTCMSDQCARYGVS